jgi:hypothetical protein
MAIAVANNIAGIKTSTLKRNPRTTPAMVQITTKNYHGASVSFPTTTRLIDQLHRRQLSQVVQKIIDQPILSKARLIRLTN